MTSKPRIDALNSGAIFRLSSALALRSPVPLIHSAPPQLPLSLIAQPAPNLPGANPQPATFRSPPAAVGYPLARSRLPLISPMPLISRASLTSQTSPASTASTAAAVQPQSSPPVMPVLTADPVFSSADGSESSPAEDTVHEQTRPRPRPRPRRQPRGGSSEVTAKRRKLTAPAHGPDPGQGSPPAPKPVTVELLPVRLPVVFPAATRVLQPCDPMFMRTARHSYPRLLALLNALECAPDAVSGLHDVAISALIALTPLPPAHNGALSTLMHTMTVLNMRLPPAEQHGWLEIVANAGHQLYFSPLYVHHVLWAASPACVEAFLGQHRAFRYWFALAALALPYDPQLLPAEAVGVLEPRIFLDVLTPAQLAYTLHRLQHSTHPQAGPFAEAVLAALEAVVGDEWLPYLTTFAVALWHRGLLLRAPTPPFSPLSRWLAGRGGLKLCHAARHPSASDWLAEETAAGIELPPYLHAFPALVQEVRVFLAGSARLAEVKLEGAVDPGISALFTAELDVLDPSVSMAAIQRAQAEQPWTEIRFERVARPPDFMAQVALGVEQFFK